MPITPKPFKVRALVLCERGEHELPQLLNTLKQYEFRATVCHTTKDALRELRKSMQDLRLSSSGLDAVLGENGTHGTSTTVSGENGKHEVKHVHFAGDDGAAAGGGAPSASPGASPVASPALGSFVAMGPGSLRRAMSDSVAGRDGRHHGNVDARSSRFFFDVVITKLGTADNPALDGCKLIEHLWNQTFVIAWSWTAKENPKMRFQVCDMGVNMVATDFFHIGSVLEKIRRIKNMPRTFASALQKDGPKTGCKSKKKKKSKKSKSGTATSKSPDAPEKKTLSLSENLKAPPAGLDYDSSSSSEEQSSSSRDSSDSDDPFEWSKSDVELLVNAQTMDCRRAEARLDQRRRARERKDDPYFCCPFCGLAGLTEDGLWLHTSLYHANLISDRSERRHKKLPEDHIAHACPVCSERDRNLMIHIRNAHGPCSPTRCEVHSEFNDVSPQLAAFALVVCVDYRNRMLLVQEYGSSGYWLPGGRVDAGETFEEAAVRECEEEAGVKIRLTGVLQVQFSPGEKPNKSDSTKSDSSHSKPKSAAYCRQRIVFLAEPVLDAKAAEPPEPKTEPDYESVGAVWCALEKIDGLALRGSEPAFWGKYLQSKKPVHPMAVLSGTEN